MPLQLLQFDVLLPSFALVLARVGGLVMAVPMFSSRQIPRATKVWLIATLALMVFPSAMPVLPRSLTLAEAGVGMVAEFMIGEIIGFGVGMAFFAAQIAGKLVSHQSGMALGTVFNPIFDSQSTILDQILFFSTLMLFLAFRGHVATVGVLVGSFQTVPPMMFEFDGTLAQFITGMMEAMFELALRLSGPAIAALFLTSLIMGFLTKTMPQLNILSVGFSFKIAAALLMVGVTISYTGDAIGDAIFSSLDQLALLFEDMSRQVMNAG